MLPYMRRVFLQAVCCAVLVLGVCGLVACSDPVPSAGSPPVTQLTAANVQVLGAAEQEGPVGAKPATAKKDNDKTEYHIGAGDRLFFSLYMLGGKEESKRIYPTTTYVNQQEQALAVRQDGTVGFPYVGDVKVVGKTESALRAQLEKEYARYFKLPQVDVRVAEFNAHRVVVTGEVEKPGEQSLSHADLTVAKALEAAGGPTPAADLRAAEIRHQDGTSENVDILALLYEGDTSGNKTLAEGDSLYIPTNHRNRVFVMGEVVKPAAQYIPKGRLSLTEALMEAGGLDKITASRASVYVIRGAVSERMTERRASSAPPPTVDAGAMQVAVYQLDASTADAFIIADQFMLKPRDVVYVSERGITEWNRFISQLIPSSVQSLLYGSLFDNSN